MTFSLKPSDSFAPHTEAVESRLGEETVILHLESGIYFGLDAVGTVVWERLQAGDSLEEICKQVKDAYEDAPDTVDDDIFTFLTQLLEHSLIEHRS